MGARAERNRWGVTATVTRLIPRDDRVVSSAALLLTSLLLRRNPRALLPSRLPTGLPAPTLCMTALPRNINRLICVSQKRLCPRATLIDQSTMSSKVAAFAAFD